MTLSQYRSSFSYSPFRKVCVGVSMKDMCRLKADLTQKFWKIRDESAVSIVLESWVWKIHDLLHPPRNGVKLLIWWCGGIVNSIRDRACFSHVSNVYFTVHRKKISRGNGNHWLIDYIKWVHNLCLSHSPLTSAIVFPNMQNFASTPPPHKSGLCQPFYRWNY